MNFISILMAFLLILTSSCNKAPTDSGEEDNNTSTTDGGGDGGGNEIDYSICENCIWLQNDCNGNWFIGYNTNNEIAGFQFTIDGLNIIINEIMGGSSEEAEFNIDYTNMVLGFSLGGNSIPAGSGQLFEINMTGIPSGLSNIVFSDSNAETLNISYYGLINCYNTTLNSTGETQLTIFRNSITNLNIGDEIGIFDLNAITNYNDCSNQIDELLVGSGIWNGNQLEIVSTGSVDLCLLDGIQIAGYVAGNPLIIKVYKPTNGLEYSTNISWEEGSGEFGEVIQVIDNITLINPPLSKRLF